MTRRTINNNKEVLTKALDALKSGPHNLGHQHPIDAETLAADIIRHATRFGLKRLKRRKTD